MAGRRSRQQPDDGMPLPPRLLMVQVAGHADGELFLAGGREAADDIRHAVRRQERDLEDMEAILDFGIGCGRVARNWSQLQRPQIFGCDHNERLVRWCRANLPFVTVERNALEPPLPQFHGAPFDLIYAISVFTHMTEETQRGWIAELSSALKPGGLLLLTTSGERFRPVLAKFDDERLADFDRGELVVTDADALGTNRCNAYHPEGWIERELLNGLELAEFSPGAIDSAGGQDLYVLRKDEQQEPEPAGVRGI